MTTVHNKHFCIRYLLFTFSFLWAFMLLGPDGVACAVERDIVSFGQVMEKDGNPEGLLLLQGDQSLAEDATFSHANFSLQHAVAPVRTHCFGKPTDEPIPPYAARAPGPNFFSQFFLTSITPHAP